MADSNCSNQAWVTLTTNDSYALGALVLAHSLRRCGTTRKVVVLVTNEVTEVMMNLLSDVFDEVVNVATMDSEDEMNLNLLERPELGITFTKLHCWKLTQYTKCVFLDADTMMVQNSDELFEREEFSAAPDAGWPDCFNSGVFVFVPSVDTYRALIEHASREGSFDGGDQGLLNTFFSDWPTSDIKKHLPFLYNMVATATYTYLPAFKKFGNDVKIVHFIGVSKPWHATFDSEGQPIPKQKEDRHAAKHLIHWWHIFDCAVRHRLPGYSKAQARQEAAGHSAGTLDSGKAEEVKMSMSESFENKIQKQAWEAGHPDYMGRSSMEKIIEKIDSNLSSQKPE